MDCTAIAILEVHRAFFEDVADVSDRQVQFQIAQKLSIPIADLQAQIDSGEAYALHSAGVF